MIKRTKPHLEKIERKRTSVGRDLEKGLRLDRNERVSNFSDAIINEILKTLPKHIFSAYPDTEELYEKLAQFLKLRKEEIYLTNGITEAIRIIFETLINPSDRVVMLSSTYPMYGIYAQIYEAVVVPVKFSSDLQLNKDELISAITKDTALVCLANPNLPIESYLSINEIRQLADKCKEVDATLVVDEAYAFFGAKSATSLIKEYDNIIIFQTFSKAFGLAGIRLGYMISTQENIEYVSKTRSLVESNALSMKVAEYLLDHLEIKDAYVEDVKKGLSYIRPALKELGFRVFGGDYTNGMLVFLAKKSETEDLLQFLRSKNIYIRGSFEAPIENCLRLTLGPLNQMKALIAAMAQWKRSRKA